LVTVGIKFSVLTLYTRSPCRQDDEKQGLKALLRGHSDQVNAVKFLPTATGSPQVLLTGSVDKTIRVWRATSAQAASFVSVATLEGHESSINCLAAFKGTNLIASGSADANIKIWRLSNLEVDIDIELVQTIETNPRFFPLALALHSLGTEGDFVLAVAGTKSFVQVYVFSNNEHFRYQSTLTGHEGWIRSLAITQERKYASSDMLLASASQDKHIRLWRIAKSRAQSEPEEGGMAGELEQPLSNKAHKLITSQNSYSLTFEALLLGHDDWIYTISWRFDNELVQLLSASADNSLAIWQSEENSGVWVCTTRLGEISAQKGSTTATGSTGGFWIGLWSPNGDSLVSLGRTGSWRLWNYDRDQTRWVQGIGITGHTKSVADVAWSRDGSYLLSTASDQTTRLHAAWKHGAKPSWHEMARPQIHGYDLNCIESIGQTRFISGADEKLLRVFDEPRGTADLLDTLCGIRSNAQQKLPESATIPVLGLSNKAIEDADNEEHEVDGDANAEPASVVTTASQDQTSDFEHPPFEDQLARRTLWPEREKLYGHGYEISAVAASHDASMVATACKASSLDHAVIRLYTIKDWREVKPSLTAHSLTVTALCFSEDDKYLLSVGRDRQWAVFERDPTRESYLLKHSNPKGHSRMILDACWAPMEAGRTFVTAGRDKTVKIWRMDDVNVECTATIIASSPVTAVDVAPLLLRDNLSLVVGTETGDVALHVLDLHDWVVKQASQLEIA